MRGKIKPIHQNKATPFIYHAKYIDPSPSNAGNADLLLTCL